MPSAAAAEAAAWAHAAAAEQIEVAGLATAYRRHGSGERVLYLHGDGFTRIWPPFLERLSAACEVVAPELPGWGDSAIDDTIQSFDDLVLHLDGFLAQLDLDPVHLAGQGLGGWLAADLAVFYPRRFKSLSLITPAGLRLPEAPFSDPFRVTAEERADALFNGRGDDFAEYLAQEGDPEDLIRRLSEQAAAARLMWNPRYDHRLDHRLARVTTPTLVIGVQEDRVLPTAMAARYAALIPGARLETIAGGGGEPSGHVPQIEHPDQTAALVAAHVTANS